MFIFHALDTNHTTLDTLRFKASKQGLAEHKLSNIMAQTEENDNSPSRIKYFWKYAFQGSPHHPLSGNEIKE